jgi:hypothetical protein
VAPPRRAFGQLPQSLKRGGSGAYRGGGYGAPARPLRTAERTIDRGGGISVEYDGDHGPPDEGAGFRLGQRVRHPKFGEGEVRAVTGAGDELKLTVYFRAVGPKTIIARFVEIV